MRKLKDVCHVTLYDGLIYSRTKLPVRVVTDEGDVYLYYNADTDSLVGEDKLPEDWHETALDAVRTLRRTVGTRTC